MSDYRELLIGCGSRREKTLFLPDLGQSRAWKGLTTLDVEARHNPDVVHDLNVTPWPFEDGVFDEVHAYEVLEHLGQQGDAPSFFATFTEIYRVLKPGGLLFATCPSYRSMWAWGDPSHRRIICSGSLVFLSQPQYTKQIGKTPMSDFRSLYRADFDVGTQEDNGETFRFVLQAVKPSRISV
jgi:SAM-dependent methyltransferase